MNQSQEDQKDREGTTHREIREIKEGDVVRGLRPRRRALVPVFLIF